MVADTRKSIIYRRICDEFFMDYVTSFTQDLMTRLTKNIDYLGDCDSEKEV